MPKEKTKRRLQPVRSSHIDDITKRFGAIQTDRKYKPYNRTIRKKDRKSQETYEVMPFSLTPSSFPPPPPTQMSTPAEADASEREFEELLGIGPNDYGDKTKSVDDMDVITQSFSNTSLKDASLPPPPAPMSAANEDAANEREFEELLGIGPNDYGDKTKSVDDMDVITQSFSNTSLRDKRGGYRKNKSRRHKTRRHKSRRHKTRRHKTRRHKSRR